MTKEQAGQTVVGVYNALQNVTVAGQQNTAIMAGVFQALKELSDYFKQGQGGDADGTTDESTVC